ncbi:HHR149Wp [Eremothecium sinecaudum]|uniref:HHR149Wp n=1 Tax=Eremothecium sinecaudum TaxID=45286 RepID=A0A109V0Q3_9SACH|nr:HHR149Wp [Eremothecium sinecaudum]AMD22918.1 HHR149Wp [Eremothecium sinecaudum]
MVAETCTTTDTGSGGHTGTFDTPKSTSSRSLSNMFGYEEDGGIISRFAIIQRIKENRGLFEGDVQWCSNLLLDNWKESRLRITERGMMARDDVPVSSGSTGSRLLHSASSKLSHKVNETVQQVPLIKHLQSCSLRLMSNAGGSHPILEVGTYHSKVYIKLTDQNTFLDIFSALLFWKSLQTAGVFNKFSVVSPIFPSSSEPTNLLVCQFNIFGPLPKNKNVVQLTNLKRPPTLEGTLPTPDEGWFSAMGVLKSDGELDLLLQSDGSLLHSIDIKKLLRSEIQVLDSSILQNDNFMFIGMLPELRRQLGVSSNDNMFVSKMRPGTTPRLYLQFPLRIDLEDWFVALHSFAMLEVLSLIGTDKSNELKVSNRFKITILEADLRLLEGKRSNHNITSNGVMTNEGEDSPGVPRSFYATISVWNHQLARTPVVSGTYTPFWREELDFNFSVRTDSVRIGVREIVGSKGEYSEDDVLLGYIEISQDMINDCELNKETRLPVFAVDNKGFQLGTICIKLASCLNFVLPSLNFHKFESILEEIDLHVMTHYVYNKIMVENLKLDGITTVFLDIFQAIGREDEWFQALIERELITFDQSVLNNSQNAVSSNHIYNSLFRGNSVLSKSIEKYFNRIGKEYLEKALGPIIRGIISEGESCEMDPSKICELDEYKKLTVLEANHARLRKWAESIWSTIYKTSNNLPKGIIDQLTLFRNKLEIVCGNVNLKMVLNSISAFLFLRFFCPVILNPKLFHIVKEHPNEQQRRVLTLISKVVMNLSTLTTFGSKEPWMNSMNEFIEKHREELLAYADKVTQRKLDFNHKILKLSDSVARPKLEMNKEIIKDLATNPYLIERYLRETELVNALIKYRETLTSAMKPDSSDSSKHDIPKPSQLLSSGSDTGLAATSIGELEFEKITENNVEVFGHDMLKYLESDEGPKKRPSSRMQNSKESIDLAAQLEQEAALLFHRIRHLISLLSDYEYPSDIILGKAEYAAFLVESAYYDPQRRILLDFDNMFAKKDGLTKLFQDSRSAGIFFSPVTASDAATPTTRTGDSSAHIDDNQEVKLAKMKLTNSIPTTSKRFTKLFRKIGF